MRFLLLASWLLIVVLGQAPEPIFGTNEYIEYIPGTGPIIISAPHGGNLSPSSIPDRTEGSNTADARTQQISRSLVTEIENQAGARFRPHLIINRLERAKLDANRDKDEAAEGNPQAEVAWEEYHGFIETAKTNVTRIYGKGLYIDLHGQSHEQEWTELGYLLTRIELSLSDNALDQARIINITSIRHRGTIASQQGTSFSSFLRGSRSLGGLLQSLGIKSIPSPDYPDPSGGNYFNGGYSTQRHGSLSSGTIDGIQIELSRPFRYAEPADLAENIRDLAEAIISFYQLYWE